LDVTQVRFAGVRLLAVTVALIVAGAAVSSHAARGTTVPGLLYVVNVTLTDNKIQLSHKSDRSLTKLPRGAYIRYAITNRGTRRYVFRIWATQSGRVRPGGKDSLVINWNYRGRFAYLMLFHGKPVGPKGYITIY
jgi:hypothetical protein